MRFILIVTFVFCCSFSPIRARAQNCKPDVSSVDKITKQQNDIWVQNVFATSFGSSLMSTSEVNISVSVGRYGNINAVNVEIRKAEESSQNAVFESNLRAVKGNQFLLGFKDGQPLSFVATDVGNTAEVGGIITGQLITTVILSAIESDETMAALREALTKRPVDAIRVILAGDVIIEKSVNDANGRKLMNKFICFYQSLDNRGLSLPATGVPQSQPVQPGAASAGAASVTRSKDRLPDAKALLSKYRVAIGGAEALAGKKSMQQTGSFHMPAQRITTEINIWSARPNRSVSKFTIPGFGDICSGYTGEVGWALDPGDGPRLLEGAEAQQAKHDAEFELFLRPDALIKAVTTVERTKFSGRDCFKVKVEWKSGRESFDYYSSETGLLIGTSGKQGFKTRSVEIVTLIDDYKIFDGINMPTKYTTKFSGTEQVIALKEIKFDGIADSAFDPPAEVKALFPKSRSASSVNSKMTNDDVIQLITAGLSEQVVITSIRQASAKDFDLTPKGLISLKKAGVSDAVIMVMQE